MDGDWKNERAVPSLTCRVIQDFGGPKALQWGGMIRWIIHLQKLHWSNMVQYLLIYGSNSYTKHYMQPSLNFCSMSRAVAHQPRSCAWAALLHMSRVVAHDPRSCSMGHAVCAPSSWTSNGSWRLVTCYDICEVVTMDWVYGEVLICCDICGVSSGTKWLRYISHSRVASTCAW